MQATDAELKSLMEENNRLRKVMLDAAGKMGPEARQRFVKDYERIADKAEKLGLKVDTELTKAAAAASQPSSSRPDFSKAPPPPSFASFPPTPSSSSSVNSGDSIDSKSYLMDIINLSVDLDPEDDHDTHSVSNTGGLSSSEFLDARKLIASHDPEQLVAEKHHWMIVTVPEKPVAGEVRPSVPLF